MFQASNVSVWRKIFILDNVVILRSSAIGYLLTYSRYWPQHVSHHSWQGLITHPSNNTCTYFNFLSLHFHECGKIKTCSGSARFTCRSIICLLRVVPSGRSHLCLKLLVCTWNISIYITLHKDPLSTIIHKDHKIMDLYHK